MSANDNGEPTWQDALLDQSYPNRELEVTPKDDDEEAAD